MCSRSLVVGLQISVRGKPMPEWIIPPLNMVMTGGWFRIVLPISNPTWVVATKMWLHQPSPSKMQHPVPRWETQRLSWGLFYGAHHQGNGHMKCSPRGPHWFRQNDHRYSDDLGSPPFKYSYRILQVDQQSEAIRLQYTTPCVMICPQPVSKVMKKTLVQGPPASSHQD